MEGNSKGDIKGGRSTEIRDEFSEMRPDWGHIWARNFPMSKKGFLIYFRKSLDS